MVYMKQHFEQCCLNCRWSSMTELGQIGSLGCKHNPRPEGVKADRKVSPNGICEYWKKD